MLDSRKSINLLHVLFVGPLLMYIGYYKEETSAKLFNLVMILGLVVVLYHLYLLTKNKMKIKVI